MSDTGDIFQVKYLGKTLVLTPVCDLSEFEFQRIQREVLRVAEDPLIRSVVVDLGYTDYLGSTALGTLTQLCRRVQSRGGRVGFCNASEHEREILALAGLNERWPLYSSRQLALDAVAA